MLGRFQFAIYITFLLCTSSFAQVLGSSFKPGTVIPSVPCDGNPKQTYALYLPSHFSPTRKWPTLFVFDPGARGQLAVETMHTAAEKFGYIVVASNNSRNGPMGGSVEAADAMWKDAHQRFPVDERRRYLAGMSGGARLAVSIALACKECVTGVIANAAGFPGDASPSRDMKFTYYAAVGNADFNYPEFVTLRTKLTDAGARYHIRIFEGQHDWAPPEIWMEALNWMDLAAMATGNLPRDRQRIQHTFDQEIATAKQLSEKQDTLAAFRQYQSIARDFDSLTDISLAKSELEKFSKDKSLKKAEREEQDALALQTELAGDASRQIQQIASDNLGMVEYTQLRSKVADLKKQAASNPNDPKSLVIRRALGQLVVQSFEAGQRSMEQKKYEAALLYFDLTAAGSRYPEWSHYQRARVYALMSNNKGVIAELKLAIAGGLNDISALDSDEFQACREQPQFQALIAELKQKSKQ